MQRIEINHLGPIQHCEMNIDDFIVCTGAQASGKSTLAKSVYITVKMYPCSGGTDTVSPGL